MPFWTPTTVDATPELAVCSWMLIRTETGHIHVVGFNLTEGEGRVSSPLVTFDPATRIGTTKSGRRYVLQGEPGMDPDARYTFAAWCEINQVMHWDDVSAEVLAHGLPDKAYGGNMTTTPDTQRLLEVADVYLRDAEHAEQSTHGRCSCAMNALGALCLAGAGSAGDQALVDAWEAKRYDPAAWPTELQVAALIEHVVEVMQRYGTRSRQ